MDEKKISIKYFFINLIAIIITLYFFSLTKIKIENFFTINLFPVFESMLTFNFVLFLVLASLALTITILINTKFKPKIAIIINTSSYILGLIITSFLFNLSEFVIPLLFGIIGIIVTIILQEKTNYFKNCSNIRIGKKSSKKIVLFIAIGLLITGLFFTSQNIEYHEQNFVNNFFDITIGKETTIYSNINDPLIDSIIITQQQTINTIKQLPYYSQLENKEDLELQTFLQSFNQLEQTIKSNEYKELLIEETQKKQETIDLNKELLNSFPIIIKLSKMAWLLYPTFIFFYAIMIGRLIISNLTGLLFCIIKSYEKDIEQENNAY